jgi:hypothetical protein
MRHELRELNSAGNTLGLVILLVIAGYAAIILSPVILTVLIGYGIYRAVQWIRRRRTRRASRDADNRERRSLVSGLIAGPCAECTAGPGETCTGSSAEISVLDKKIMAHTGRILAAIDAGRVSREQVIAQFGDSPPAGLAEEVTT